MEEKEENSLNYNYNYLEEIFVGDCAKTESKRERGKINKRTLAKTLRNQGQEYISSSTKKTIPARYMKSRCDSKTCRNCFEVTEEQREQIFHNFNNIGDLHLQREFLVRHLEVKETSRSRSKGTSRRQHTITYKLTVNKRSVIVCKKLFLNTLGITEKMCRTAVSKLNEFGVLERDQRGGRQRSEEVKERERNMNKTIEEHILKFPRRKKRNGSGSDPEMTFRKMYDLYVAESASQGNSGLKASFSLYMKIYRSLRKK